MSHKFKKQFGQNFLKHNRFVVDLLSHLKIEKNDLIIEIGPGDGKLTEKLIESGAEIISIEVDYDLIAPLIKNFGERSNFDIINEDILKVNFEEIPVYKAAESIKVVGSLPYNISKDIIELFLEMGSKDNRIKRMAFIVQEEVSRKYSESAPNATVFNSVASIYANVSKGKSIPASQFYPKPKVNGGIVVFEFIDRGLSPEEIESIKKLIKIGFSSKKKKVINNLINSNKYSEQKIKDFFLKEKIEQDARPSQISIENWIKLNSHL